MTTLQSTNNLLSSLIVGLSNLTTSSDIATNKSNDKVNCNNSHKCIASAISFISGLYYALLRYVNQYIYHTAKLFCFVGWTVSIQYPAMGKGTVLGLLLVTNHPINFSKKQQEEYSHV
ncbi:hypothetical protein LO80_02510 [Candidatus Francisella endociliophora]|uniref:Uncharacterized protein n=1 Tax=Candidatus Francisella endociliophora TaxID=653937 RepID=A0A097EN26_9GAMM|nr:hypothetical protein [Francisella sp. FSC1006]AIT08965.1 hypothetical protein LO80_02510 [Francisella sp. FSC1006]